MKLGMGWFELVHNQRVPIPSLVISFGRWDSARDLIFGFWLVSKTPYQIPNRCFHFISIKPTIHYSTQFRIKASKSKRLVDSNSTFLASYLLINLESHTHTYNWFSHIFICSLQTWGILALCWCSSLSFSQSTPSRRRPIWFSKHARPQNTTISASRRWNPIPPAPKPTPRGWRWSWSEWEWPMPAPPTPTSRRKCWAQPTIPPSRKPSRSVQTSMHLQMRPSTPHFKIWEMTSTITPTCMLWPPPTTPTPAATPSRGFIPRKSLSGRMPLSVSAT